MDPHGAVPQAQQEAETEFWKIPHVLADTVFVPFLWGEGNGKSKDNYFLSMDGFSCGESHFIFVTKGSALCVPAVSRVGPFGDRPERI